MVLASTSQGRKADQGVVHVRAWRRKQVDDEAMLLRIVSQPQQGGGKSFDWRSADAGKVTEL